MQVPLYHPAGLAHRVLSLMSVRRPADPRDDLKAAGEVLRRYARSGFDDAVVLIGPGGPGPEDVRALLSRESPTS